MADQRFEVDYLYRDASNYKFRGSFIVDGDLDLEMLRPLLLDGAWFVPERVGLPALRPRETCVPTRAASAGFSSTN